jgi:transposase
MQTATVGIDVSKAKLDVVLLGSDGGEQHWQGSNDSSGHAALREWLQQQGMSAIPVCLEATGRYGQAVAEHLQQQGYAVSVVNPAPVKHFAAALMKRHKTDKSDASVLARYAAHLQPPAWQPPSRLHSHLQELKRLIDDLHTDHTRVQNRLEGVRAGSPARRYLEQQRRQLEQQLHDAQQELDELIAGDDAMQAQCALLVSIRGIGRTSAIQLLSELPDLSQFQSADQLVAYAGLCPRQQQSGQQPGYSYLSKQGNPQIRKALYFPALSAKTHNPHLRAFAQRLTAAGKAKMTVVAAVMRKLLVLVYAILKSGRPYDPTFGLTA